MAQDYDVRGPDGTSIGAVRWNGTGEPTDADLARMAAGLRGQTGPSLRPQSPASTPTGISPTMPWGDALHQLSQYDQGERKGLEYSAPESARRGALRLLLQRKYQQLQKVVAQNRNAQALNEFSPSDIPKFQAQERALTTLEQNKRLWSQPPQTKANSAGSTSGGANANPLTAGPGRQIAAAGRQDNSARSRHAGDTIPKVRVQDIPDSFKIPSIPAYVLAQDATAGKPIQKTRADWAAHWARIVNGIPSAHPTGPDYVTFEGASRGIQDYVNETTESIADWLKNLGGGVPADVAAHIALVNNPLGVFPAVHDAVKDAGAGLIANTVTTLPQAGSSLLTATDTTRPASDRLKATGEVALAAFRPEAFIAELGKAGIGAAKSAIITAQAKQLLKAGNVEEFFAFIKGLEAQGVDWKPAILPNLPQDLAKAVKTGVKAALRPRFMGHAEPAAPSVSEAPRGPRVGGPRVRSDTSAYAEMAGKGSKGPDKTIRPQEPIIGTPGKDGTFLAIDREKDKGQAFAHSKDAADMLLAYFKGLDERLFDKSPGFDQQYADVLKTLPEYSDGFSLQFHNSINSSKARGMYSAFSGIAQIARNYRGSDLLGTVIHEFAHHLQFFLNERDMRILQKQFELESERDSLHSNAYRYKNFSEWWAESVRDKVQREQFDKIALDKIENPFLRVLKRSWIAVKGVLNTLYRVYIRKGRRDEASRIYEAITSPVRSPSGTFKREHLGMSGPGGEQLIDDIGFGG
ncbi:hypothetical protein [Fimbriimonas ginsengisoli]|uniref:Uncharacterized protein n=1 Tax=Fimbriimonas ginsengisoli Gsoil 348 TaxID=661478 RepID=A0A068NTY5_FIMGI|nr:hypothetical protein [Fimbriimonas ginsengisoli]AIE86998.1 hypothetical protein OP10G_3630 [Fimbriimonas ginsengisoli Gsoil 348]